MDPCRGRSSVVERQLPKLNVVGSIPIARSNQCSTYKAFHPPGRLCFMSRSTLSLLGAPSAPWCVPSLFSLPYLKEKRNVRNVRNDGTQERRGFQMGRSIFSNVRNVRRNVPRFRPNEGLSTGTTGQAGLHYGRGNPMSRTLSPPLPSGGFALWPPGNVFTRPRCRHRKGPIGASSHARMVGVRRSRRGA